MRKRLRGRSPEETPQVSATPREPINWLDNAGEKSRRFEQAGERRGIE
jgi:hypothetical protein